MNRQTILDALNSLDVIETGGGENPYVLVLNNEANRKKLNAVGISNQEIDNAGDKEMFCILTLAFNGGYADTYSPEKGLTLKEPHISSSLRKRILSGDATNSDAKQLLILLDQKEEELFRLKKEILTLKDHILNAVLDDHVKTKQAYGQKRR